MSVKTVADKIKEMVEIDSAKKITRLTDPDEPRPLNLNEKAEEYIHEAQKEENKTDEHTEKAGALPRSSEVVSI